MKALLIDGNNILSRATHAARHAAMSVDEVETGSLLIFIGMLSRYVREVRPTHVGIYWDSGHSLRDEIFPEYKANRDAAPADRDDDDRPFGQAKMFCHYAGVSSFEMTGWEADDLIATAHFEVGAEHGETVILSGDKDLLQLLDERTTQVRPPDDEPWTPERVRTHFGCYPSEFAQYLALVGDQSDGVPGAPGIGPKRALAAMEAADWDWEATLARLKPEQAVMGALCLRLVDLRTAEMVEAYQGAALIPGPWLPVGPTSVRYLWTPLLEFLQHWKLETVIDRLTNATMWEDRQDEGFLTSMFDGVDPAGGTS